MVRGLVDAQEESTVSHFISNLKYAGAGGMWKNGSPLRLEEKENNGNKEGEGGSRYGDADGGGLRRLMDEE